jgi:hypothetical protein
LKDENRIPFREAMPRIRIGQQSVPLPANRFARLALGLVLIGGGVLGFLPILGFWMIPLGLLVLSFDLPQVRRWRRRFLVRHAERLRRRHPTFAGWLGLGRRHPQHPEQTGPPAV